MQNLEVLMFYKLAQYYKHKLMNLNKDTHEDKDIYTHSDIIHTCDCEDKRRDFEKLTCVRCGRVPTSKLGYELILIG